VEAMNEGLITNWNDTVQRKDTVYIVGDFAWKYHNKFLMALNGKKILIIGSHDKMNQDALRNFTDVVGADKRPGILTLTLDKQLLALCHYRLSSWPISHHGSWHLFGHSHGRSPVKDYQLCADVGVDCNNYRPVSWDTIKQTFAKKHEAWRAYIFNLKHPHPREV
jgi:calcineurin-like phosphoesterase family protein